MTIQEIEKLQELFREVDQRLRKIEEWIDQWKTYDSGWNEYRKQKPNS